MRSLKHINAYLCLHGKNVSKGAVDKFLAILQGDIKAGKITKAKDKFTNEVDRIQRSLVGMSNAMWPGEFAKVEIEPARKKHYEGVLAGQGLGFIPIMIGGAVAKLCEHHITKFFSKDKGLSGPGFKERSDSPENIKDIKVELEAKGYNVALPYGNTEVSVLGWNKSKKKYFEAKQAKAKSIVEELEYQGYKAYTKKSYDGYWDIYVTGKKELSGSDISEAERNKWIAIHTKQLEQAELDLEKANTKAGILDARKQIKWLKGALKNAKALTVSGVSKLKKPSGTILSKDQAQKLCSDWHDGQNSALYQFASSKVFVPENFDKYIFEIESIQRHLATSTGKAYKDMQSLKKFFQYKNWELNKGVSGTGKPKLLASSPTEAGILAIINKYFYSTTFKLVDGVLYNSKGPVNNFTVDQKKGRYRFLETGGAISGSDEKKIIKLQLITKNNKKNGFYFYTPIVLMNGKYYWCESIKSNRVLKIADVKNEQIKITREIPLEFYKANGLTGLKADQNKLKKYVKNKRVRLTHGYKLAKRKKSVTKKKKRITKVLPVKKKVTPKKIAPKKVVTKSAFKEVAAKVKAKDKTIKKVVILLSKDKFIDLETNKTITTDQLKDFANKVGNVAAVGKDFHLTGRFQVMKSDQKTVVKKLPTAKIIALPKKVEEKKKVLKKVSFMFKNQPETFEEAVLLYFLKNGKITTSDFKRYTGFGVKNDRTGKTHGGKEFKSYIWAYKTKAMSIDNLVHALWTEDMNMPESSLDEQGRINEFFEILTSHSGKKSMMNAVIELQMDAAKDKNASPEMLREAKDAEEAEKYFNEYPLSMKEINDFIAENDYRNEFEKKYEMLAGSKKPSANKFKSLIGKELWADIPGLFKIVKIDQVLKNKFKVERKNVDHRVTSSVIENWTNKELTDLKNGKLVNGFQLYSVWKKSSSKKAAVKNESLGTISNTVNEVLASMRKTGPVSSRINKNTHALPSSNQKMVVNVIEKEEIMPMDKTNSSPIVHSVSQTEGTISGTEMGNMTFEKLNLNDYYKGIFGSPATNFDMCIDGAPGSGKTVFLLKFANYLADYQGPTLFITTEEFGSSTLIDKVNRFNIKSKNLHFAKKVPAAENLSKYKFIFIDSINHAKITIEQYQQMREKAPKSAFILVLQQTKGGSYKGSTDWPHEVEITQSLFKNEFDERMLKISKDRYTDPIPRTVKI